MNKRFRKPSFWLATLAIIYFVAKSWFKFTIPDWDGFVAVLIAALGAWGVIDDYGEKVNPNVNL